MQTLTNKLNSFWFGALLILVVAGIAYLPLVGRLGYLNDEWYLMYDMQVKGADFFHEIFGIDRPGRALAMIPFFSLFGFDLFWYHLSAAGAILISVQIWLVTRAMWMRSAR